MNAHSTESAKQLNAQITVFLQQLQSLIADFQPQATENSSKSKALESVASTSTANAPVQVMQLQQQFLQVIEAIAATSLSESQSVQLRPCQTEAHRRLRLLGVDVMKLKTAKQAETRAAAHRQIVAHLEEIRAFAQKMTQILVY